MNLLEVIATFKCKKLPSIYIFGDFIACVRGRKVWGFVNQLLPVYVWEVRMCGKLFTYLFRDGDGLSIELINTHLFDPILVNCVSEMLLDLKARKSIGTRWSVGKE